MRVPYSAEKMFDLVNEVERYPQFLHWCTGAVVEYAETDKIFTNPDDKRTEDYVTGKFG